MFRPKAREAEAGKGEPVKERYLYSHLTDFRAAVFGHFAHCLLKL